MQQGLTTESLKWLGSLPNKDELVATIKWHENPWYYCEDGRLRPGEPLYETRIDVRDISSSQLQMTLFQWFDAATSQEVDQYLQKVCQEISRLGYPVLYKNADLDLVA